MGREQRGRPCEWGDLREGVCEHVGVLETGGPAHLWNPLSVWKGWGAQMGRAHANGGRERGGAVNEGDEGAPKPETELACSGKLVIPK